MAELWWKKKHGGLTEEEQRELEHCLDANMRKVRRLAELENLSYVASLVQDTDWQHEICKKIEELIPHYTR